MMIQLFDSYFLKGLKAQQHMTSNEKTEAMTINAKVKQSSHSICW